MEREVLKGMKGVIWERGDMGKGWGGMEGCEAWKGVVRRSAVGKGAER